MLPHLVCVSHPSLPNDIIGQQEIVRHCMVGEVYRLQCTVYTVYHVKCTVYSVHYVKYTLYTKHSVSTVDHPVHVPPSLPTANQRTTGVDQAEQT